MITTKLVVPIDQAVGLYYGGETNRVRWMIPEVYLMQRQLRDETQPLRPRKSEWMHAEESRQQLDAISDSSSYPRMSIVTPSDSIMEEPIRSVPVPDPATREEMSKNRRDIPIEEYAFGA